MCGYPENPDGNLFDIGVSVYNFSKNHGIIVDVNDAAFAYENGDPVTMTSEEDKEYRLFLRGNYCSDFVNVIVPQSERFPIGSETVNLPDLSESDASDLISALARDENLNQLEISPCTDGVYKKGITGWLTGKTDDPQDGEFWNVSGLGSGSLNANMEVSWRCVELQDFIMSTEP